MNIFEKIKQIFKNLGKKQKLLDAPKGKVSDVQDFEVSAEKVEKSFREELKFDPKDLLNPEVCKGDDLIPNILKTLGVNKAILDNPFMLGELKSICSEIIKDKYHKFNLDDTREYTTDEINAMVDQLKLRGNLLDSASKFSIYINGSGDMHRASLSISDDGKVTVQNFDTKKGYGATDKSITFSYDIQTGKTFRDVTVHTNRGNGEVLSFEKNETYEETGLKTHEDIIRYNQDQYSLDYGKVDRHEVVSRDSEYPFVSQKQTLVKDGAEVDRKEYFPIKSSNLAGLESGVIDVDGKPIVFTDRAQILEYYKQNKEEIAQTCTREPSVSGSTLKQRQALKKAIVGLAQKAGILPKEQETEKQD